MSSFRRSEPPTPPARPKLSDALDRVADDHRQGAMSPRRGMFATAASPSPVQSPRMRPAAGTTGRKVNRQQQQQSQSPPPLHHNAQVPEQVSLQSKSEGSSKFTRLARGLKPEIERGRDDEIAWAEANARSSNPFAGVTSHTADARPATRTRHAAQSQAGPSKVHLPDVTGLTLALDTPVRSRMVYRTAASPVRPQNSACCPLRCVIAKTA